MSILTDRCFECNKPLDNSNRRCFFEVGEAKAKGLEIEPLYLCDDAKCLACMRDTSPWNIAPISRREESDAVLNAEFGRKDVPADYED
jgi:hypothetical protein